MKTKTVYEFEEGDMLVGYDGSYPYVAICAELGYWDMSHMISSKSNDEIIAMLEKGQLQYIGKSGDYFA